MKTERLYLDFRGPRSSMDQASLQEEQGGACEALACQGRG